MIKVLVADDHAVVRRGLRQILAETPDILVGGEASTGPDALRLVRDERWDVVVLDINLQGSNGLEILAEIHRDRPELPVLILTVYSEEQYALRAVRAGAAGFLTKESAPENLIDRGAESGGGRALRDRGARRTQSGDLRGRQARGAPTRSCRIASSRS